MVDIFISYAHRDIKKVKILAQLLRAQGWSVWWDRHLTAGRRFDTEIREVINSARCVVVFWSNASINSEFVLDEAELGRKRNILITVQLEKVILPLGFGRRVAIDLSDWKSEKTHSGFIKLLKSLETILGPNPRFTINPTPFNEDKNKGMEPRTFIKSFKKKLFFKYIIVLIICFGFAFLFLEENDNEQESKPKLALQALDLQSVEFNTHPPANLFLTHSNQVQGPFRTPYEFKAPYGELINWKVELNGYKTRSDILAVGVSGQNNYSFRLEKIE